MGAAVLGTQFEDREPDETGYHRFRIETKLAPNAYAVPSKFDVKARKLSLAAMLIHETFRYRFNRQVVLSRPCIYGVFGGFFGGFKPIKEKCVGCMRCVQEYPHIMTVKHSEEYQKLGDSHWTPDAIFTILYEASTGRIPIKGMGYKGSFAGNGFDGIWTDMSEIVRPTRDGVYGREYISTVADVGRKAFAIDFSRNVLDGNDRSVEVPIPVLFDELPSPCLSGEIQEAISSAAARLGTFHISQHSEKTQIRPESSIPIVATRDQAETFASPEAGIVEFRDEDENVENIKNACPEAIISARLALKEGCEDRAARLVEEGADVLHVYADLHGMDYSSTPRHISAAVRSLHSYLVKKGIRNRVTLIASGGITLAEHVPKAIICGADLVGIDTALLVALQSEFKGDAKDREDCRLACRKIDPAWGSQRVVNLMASWHDQLIEILSAMGMRDVRRLRGDAGRSMQDSELREQAFEGIKWAA